ncbi:YgfZ/GcvT domain-containing protein [Tianweitania populi]|uniref:Aminomethyltransferase n=1 Tax=Tianweitania populi TaxID=1607949 RepID=A0A8J3DRW8_9HYPH|nr:folate-binding protein YgfZ [Tianweitania populi]GHD06830.1 aminomethyltransferase [Tianweitania populi]
MPVVSLPDRASILVTGPEAEDFLQNILTLDLHTLQPGEARPGALLTPQGKILFDFLISRMNGGFRLECRSDIAADFARRLMMYRLRAKVEITVDDESLVHISWGEESASSQLESSVPDRRFADGFVRRFYDADLSASATMDEWTAYRVAQGVAESGSDYELSDAFPHDVLLDQNGGVGFKKGCYVGQEVVSRMQHRGTARRRMLIAKADTALPASGTPITVDGRPIGTMGSSAGSAGLALVRLDKVKSAIDRVVPVLAGETSITLSIPAWATFGFPEATAAED